MLGFKPAKTPAEINDRLRSDCHLGDLVDIERY